MGTDYVYLDGENSGYWSIRYNPVGDGLAICIDRGISCENHTQIISCHTTNTPDLEDISKAVASVRQKIIEIIDAFVKLMHMLDNWEVKESISLLFAHQLLKDIIEITPTEDGGRS